MEWSADGKLLGDVDWESRRSPVLVVELILARQCSSKLVPRNLLSTPILCQPALPTNLSQKLWGTSNQHFKSSPGDYLVCWHSKTCSKRYGSCTGLPLFQSVCLFKLSLLRCYEAEDWFFESQLIIIFYDYLELIKSNDCRFGLCNKAPKWNSLLMKVTDFSLIQISNNIIFISENVGILHII